MPDLVFPPLYIVIILFVVMLYLFGAFALGVIGALLTLPVLYYTGYGLVPPRLAPAETSAQLYVGGLVHLVLGGVFGVICLVVAFFTRPMIPPLVRYRFARVSPRFEPLPELAVGLGLAFVVWLGYLVYSRGKLAGAAHDGTGTALAASIRAAALFCVSFIALAVVSTATLYV